MRYRSVSIIVILAILFFSSCQGQEKTNSIRDLAEKYFHDNKVNGLFIGILDNGTRTWYSYGYADPDKKMPFDSTTIFEIGSITKTFTAYVLTAVLKENGIDEGESILSFLPDSVQQNKSLEKISFLNLMNHTSGLARVPSNMDLNSMTPYDNYSLNDLYRYLKTCEPKPDGKSNYSNLGMGLAGILAERISGKKYNDLLDQYIFIPFKMGKADKNLKEISNKAKGEFQGMPVPYWNINALAPAGNIKSNGNEMLTYLQHISIPSTDSSAAIISKVLQPTASVTLTMQISRAWHIVKDSTREFFWHNGGTYGFTSFAAFQKNSGKAVVLVVNTFNGDRTPDKLGFAIARELFK